MKVYRSFGSSSIGRFVLPLLLLQQSFDRAFVTCKSSGPHYKTVPLTGGYELVCRKHEILQCTVPCCEPTCDNDCSKACCPVEVVRRKTCVCEPGYVRHKGKCIHRSRCPPKPPAPCVCGPNEELLPSPPSCEPSCTDDCSSSVYHTRYIDQPTCVCRKGYRRHQGKCIRVDQCPTCGPYATLRPHAPCCEPTCINDCSNVICISESYGEPACVCQDGYVKHNATCIRKETCPNHQPTYVKHVPETVTESPRVVYPSHPASCGHYSEHSDHYGRYETSAHSAGCDCRKCSYSLTIPPPKPTIPTPKPTEPTPKPTAKPVAPYLLPFPTGCGCGQHPCPHIAQYAPPTGCGCGQNPCPHVAKPAPPIGCGCGQNPCPHVAKPAPPIGCGCGQNPCPHVAKPAPPTGCGCGQIPCPHVAKPAPPIGCGCGQSPCPHVAQYATPTGCGCGQNPCPHSVDTKLPVPYYQAVSLSTQKDQPYYSIPALKQCSCNIANHPKHAVHCPTPGLGHPIRPTAAPCEKHSPAKPQYQEPTYNHEAKDPYLLSPYQLAPLYTVTTPPPPPPTTTTVPAPYATFQYEHPYYQHSDQVVNVPYQYIPHQYKSTLTEVHSKDQCYLPLPATVSPIAQPIDVSYIRVPSPACFSSHRHS